MGKYQKSDLIYPELSYEIIGVLYSVSNELGYGHKEKVYERAVAVGLEKKELKYTCQLHTPVYFEGKRVGSYFFDFLVENKIVLELKAGNHFSKKNIDQLSTYLKTNNLKLGILAQFTMNGVKFRRVVNDDSYIRNWSQDMKYKYIDIHSHIQGKEYDADREEVIARMQKEGVGSIIVGVDKQTSVDAIALAEKHNNLWACIGVHPNDNLKEAFDHEWFEEHAKHDKVVAIGECGLDYFRREKTEEEAQRQERRFIEQIELAIEADLPLMLHVRSAHDDALRILSSYKEKHGESLRGNVHFFTASYEIAKKYHALGFTVSVPGVVTFAKEVEEAVKEIPMEWMHGETDSPFAAPVPFRGKRNEPVHVIEVVKKIAVVKEVDEEEVRRQLLKNTQSVFGI